MTWLKHQVVEVLPSALREADSRLADKPAFASPPERQDPRTASTAERQKRFTDMFAREFGFLQEQDVVARPGQQRGRRRTRRAPANDNHIASFSISRHKRYEYTSAAFPRSFETWVKCPAQSPATCRKSTQRKAHAKIIFAKRLRPAREPGITFSIDQPAQNSSRHPDLGRLGKCGSALRITECHVLADLGDHSVTITVCGRRFCN